MKSVLRQSASPALARHGALLSVCTLGLLGAAAAPAETLQQRLDATKAQLTQLQNFAAKLSASQKIRLSSSAQHLLFAAENIDQITAPLTRNPAALNAPLQGLPFSPGAPLPGGQVSDPSTDLTFSRMAGFTQSETSTAWCGHNVVVAYNDSGSFLETLPIPGIGLSFNGYSVSTDGGRSFTDQGYLNPGANVFNSLGGDPVVACTDASTFYYSSLFSNLLGPGVSVSKSTDGGHSFADPVPAIVKDPATHFIDKPWMAADPTNAHNLYVTYTDFDASGLVCGVDTFGFPNFRLGIELVASKDGGATWSNPVIIDQGCTPNFDQGSNVAVDNHGTVYVAWENFPAALPTNEIDIVKSIDGGVSFGHKTAVAIVTPVGSFAFGLLQGGFRNNEFPSVAIDRSHRATDGTVYVAWNDGKNGVTPDGFPPGSGLTYDFGDAYVGSSADHGTTWSVPVKMNDATGASGAPADHYLPGIAVDSAGHVGACWYDRRRDPGNFLIDRECAFSRDQGKHWTNHRVTDESFAAAIAADLLINPVYMGDYDGVTSDFTGRGEGVLGAYGTNKRGNPDVQFGTEN
jgi:hypothetical protein